MADIFWFFILFISCLSVFAILHIVGLRRHRPVRLMLYLMGNYLVSAALASALCYWLFSDQFSSSSSYAVANTGAVIAGFFASALYIFLGPATADRSLTAHLLMFLRRSSDGARSEDFIADAFSARDFLGKRYQECQRAGLLAVENTTVRLSAKGRYIGALYAWFLKALALRDRGEFHDSFPGEE